MQHILPSKMWSIFFMWPWVYKKTPSLPFGVTLSGVSAPCVLAALLPCYNDGTGRRPFTYQINSKLNFLAVQATFRVTCNYTWQTLATLLSCHFAAAAVTRCWDLHSCILWSLKKEKLFIQIYIWMCDQLCVHFDDQCCCRTWNFARIQNTFRSRLSWNTCLLSGGAVW